jgi:hypothetical protein
MIADIADPPPYTALSYVWGDVSNPIPITLDKKNIRVTQNLHRALQRFRKTTVLLWVDAICINQQDLDEKNVQVNMMAKIYVKAASVAVWLGPDEHNDAKELSEDVEKTVKYAVRVIEDGGEFRN